MLTAREEEGRTHGQDSGKVPRKGVRARYGRKQVQEKYQGKGELPAIGEGRVRRSAREGDKL